MLVKFFKTGGTPKGQIGRSGGGNSARDYLLFEKDENGNKVLRKGATLFRGDADMTTETINGLENRTVYSSGVISFSENENPSDELLNKLIDSYEKTLFPIFNKDQYSSYWVKHEDKGRVELHFIIANVELYIGKVLPVYHDKNDRGLVDSWQNYNNDLYGLDNPKAPQNKRSRKITKDFEVKDGYQTKDGKLSDEELKGQIYDRIFAYTKFMPNISNRDDVIKAFEQFDYKVVSKPTDKYISIEHPEQKNNPNKKLRNLRFKDDLCLLNFNRDMLKDMKSYKQQKWERDTPNRLAQSKIDLDRNLEYRIKRMEKKFKNIERKPLDNQLTKDLTQIRASNEPEFLKQVAEWQRAELKKIIGQTIEQIYKRHEHDQPEQLASLKNLHQILIDDIDSRIQDEPLTQFDEVIANYQNSKNHIVTFDSIEHDRRQAELQRLAQLEQAEIVVKPEPQPRTADDYLASLKAQIKNDTPEQPTVIDEYEQRRQQVAQGFFNRALKALSDKYNKIVAQVKEIEANKPKIWQLWESKEIWQSKIDNATFDRDDTKRAYQELKQQGVSSVHFEQAERYIKEREPDLYNRYLSVTNPEPERFNGSDKGIATPPPTVDRELSDKAKIGLQTIKNVIDAMPDGEKKDKALQEFERTKATATMQQLEQLAQIDVKVDKKPDVVIQQPTQSQDKNNDVKR